MTIASIRTLFITRYSPYPPIGGAPLRNWQNINILRNYGSVGIFSVFKGIPETKTIPGIDLWHHYNTAQPISRWEKLERQIWWLRQRGYPDVDRLYTDAAVRELEGVLTKFKPDLVIFAELWLYRYLSAVKRYPSRIIFDDHNVEALLLQQRYRSIQAKRARLWEQIEVPKIKSIERDFIRQVDRVWLCSEEDEKLLQQWYGKTSNTQIVPNGIDVAYYENVRSGKCLLPSGLEGMGKILIFVGSFTYSPNVEAAKLLINQIYPRLQKIYPDCCLLIVGKNPPQKIQESAKSYPRIIFTGKVPDVRPYLAAASVAVIPLLQGSGTRLKILEAFAASLPVVSTTKGAEGLNARDGEHLLIRDGIDNLVAGVCKIWSEVSLGEKLAESALELINQEYSWEAVNCRVKQLLATLL